MKNKIPCCIVLLFLLMAHPAAPADPAVTVSGRSLMKDGTRFIVRGIEYAPWEPGTGPGRGHDWPAADVIARDLRMIEELGANVVSVVDPPDQFFDALANTDLLVIYTFGIFQAQWGAFGSEPFARQADRHLEAFARHQENDRIMLWMLGREITPAAVSRHGPQIEAWLRQTAESMKTEAPWILVSHGNWPPTRGLNMDFADVACFSLYPGWPPEVPLRGFGKYIREELLPRAGTRPLLISEFGVNTIEVDETEQGPILRQSWSELLREGASGAVVFSFMDEWWKNYDNPVAEDAWWNRVYDERDALAHDRDPEEHYGLVRADRTPKPGYLVVQAMFKGRPDWLGRRSRFQHAAWMFGLFAIVMVSLFAWSLYAARGRGRDKTDAAPRKRKRGFTLLELLIVMAIMGMLAALLFPVVVASRKKALSAACASNLHSIHVGMVLYAADHDGALPPRTESGGALIFGNWLGSAWNPYGLGHLISGQYITDARVFYCPLNKLIRYESFYWFDIQGAESTMTYRYRENNSAGHPAHWADIYVPTSMADSRYAILADDPYRDWVKYHHITGYNVLYLNGAVLWVADEDREIVNDLYKAWEYFDEAMGGTDLTP